MLASAVLLFSSCKKEEKSTTPGSVTAKAAPYTFIVDGIVYTPSAFQAKVDGDDYIVQGLAANQSLGFLQVRLLINPQQALLVWRPVNRAWGLLPQ